MVTRRDPLQELLNLQERINRLFEESLGRGREDDAMAGLGGGWMPQADVYETPEAFVVLLELPGLEQEDVEVGVADNILTIKGERRLSGPKPESFYRMERSYGAFSRSFQLSEDVDPERVTARFKDGLLRVELPKLHTRGGWRLREKG